MDLTSGAMWGALFAIIVANILLSGDNAVVIAMAARQLPSDQQRKAIFWGSAAAIVMRVILTIVAVELLTIPYLKIIGGLLLFWIGVQLMLSDDGETDVKSHGTMAAAVRTILIADLVMSVDNVIAVAAAADKAPENMRLILLIIGLGMSIPLIIVGSTLLMKVMERYPIIIVLGAALLGFLAGSMIATDPADKVWFAEHVPNAEILVGVTGAVLVVVVAKWLELRSQGKSINE
ncbi:MAG: TerC family protein [Burkholderiales bacterium]|nr:MAG: TerC family protein [Burkholderiales bacterium]